MVNGRETNKLKIETEVLHQLCGATIFEEHKQHFADTQFELSSHYTSLLRASIRQYLTVRFHHAAKLTSIATSGPSVRHNLSKQILFKHQ